MYKFEGHGKTISEWAIKYAIKLYVATIHYKMLQQIIIKIFHIPDIGNIYLKKKIKMIEPWPCTS